MNLLKKIMLYPLAVLYGTVTSTRNKRFDQGRSKQTSFDQPVIVVGNLTVGGTGKTPHVEFLANFFIGKKKTALVSRGYGRKTKGFLIANKQSTASEIGDEPMQYYTKFKGKATIAVGEQRVLAIQKLIKRSKYNLFLLDDAFQHRSLKASFYVLLTDFTRLFTEDHILPLGLLRESREGASRADAIVVSKCPPDLDMITKDRVKEEIARYSTAPVFFSKMIQEGAFNTNGNTPLVIHSKVVTLSAIAQNQVFIDQVNEKYDVQRSFSFRDHHNFTLNDLKEVFEYVTVNNLSLVTTEKDFMRLSEPEFMELTTKMSIFVVPVKVQFLANESEFLTLIEEGMISA